MEVIRYLEIPITATRGSEPITAAIDQADQLRKDLLAWCPPNNQHEIGSDKKTVLHSLSITSLTRYSPSCHL